MSKKTQKIFGTDGVRGTANVEPVTAETALKLGRSAAHVFKNLEAAPRDQGKHRIVIGKDTRLSGYMLENAISSGILSMGVDVLFIGPLPTPGVAYATRSLRADAGIVITASHNPYDDNGIKFFGPDGHKLADNIERMVEELVFSGEIENVRPRAEAIGKAVRIEDALGRYIEFAKASFPRRMMLDGMRIVVDCANGATYKSTPCVLRELGAETFVYANTPDGTNINRECGSMYPEHLAAKVREYRADIGIAHDGDGDRMLMCDENGAILDGDDVMAICGLDMIANGRLNKKTLVTTIMSNAGLDEAIKKDLNLGGEESGHLIFGDYSSTGDGLVAALQVLATMKERNSRLSELTNCWKRFPKLVTNMRVKEKPPLEKLDGVLGLVKDAEKALKPSGGRVLLRYSGTEPKIRLLIESTDKALIEEWTGKISGSIRKQIGA